MQKSKKYFFLLVDDVQIVRKGLSKQLAEEYKDCSIDETDNIVAAKIFVHKSKYDLIVLGANAVSHEIPEFISYLKELDSQQNIVVFSNGNKEDHAKKYLELGAKAYLSSQSSYKDVSKILSIIVKAKEGITN